MKHINKCYSHFFFYIGKWKNYQKHKERLKQVSQRYQNYSEERQVKRQKKPEKDMKI